MAREDDHSTQLLNVQECQRTLSAATNESVLLIRVSVASVTSLSLPTFLYLLLVCTLNINQRLIYSIKPN